MPQTQTIPTSNRALETRARLMEAGRRAFATRPFAAVNLKRDILEPAEISVGSFYHQFKDKGELLMAIVEEHSQGLQARFSEAHRPGIERSPDMIARESYGLLFDMVDESPEMMRIRLRSDETSPEVAQFMARDEARMIETRSADYARLVATYDLTLDPDLAAEMIGMLADGAIRRYLAIPENERPAARERLLDGLVELTLHGIQGLSRTD